MAVRERKVRSLTPERSPKWVQKIGGDVLFGALMNNNNNQNDISPLGSPQRTGRGRGRSPKRVVSADRDLHYMNILATEDMVTTENIEECLDLCGSNRNISKLELEDIVSRKSDQEDIFAAILDMFRTDDENNAKRKKKKKDTRSWEYIQFVDCIRVMGDHTDTHGSSKAMFQLCDYEDNQHQLWDLIKPTAYDDVNNRKPISFRVKIEIDEGVQLESLLKIFKLWQTSSLERVEFGGALFGCDHEDIAGKLATEILQIKEDDDDEKKDDPNDDVEINPKSASRCCTLTERIIVDAYYTLPHLSTKDPPVVILECVEELTSLKERFEATWSMSWTRSKSGRRGGGGGISPSSKNRGRGSRDKKSPRRQNSPRRNGVANLEVKKKNSSKSKPAAGVKEPVKRIPRKTRTDKPPISKKKLRRRTVSIDDFAANLKLLRKETGETGKRDNLDSGEMSD